MRNDEDITATVYRIEESNSGIYLRWDSFTLLS